MTLFYRGQYFFRLQENVIGEDDYEKENNGDNDPPPAAPKYLRKRRNAVGKVKPIRTLRKRIHTDVNASSNIRNNAKPGFQIIVQVYDWFLASGLESGPIRFHLKTSLSK